VNIGAWIGDATMIDSHVLVGSCAQVGARVHLAAGVQIGGVLEPPGARPVSVEDGCFIGAGCGLFEGILVQRGAVLAAGVVLTGTAFRYRYYTRAADIDADMAAWLRHTSFERPHGGYRTAGRTPAALS
jgi:2,3,4,5-tetrahydropyridine-2,6-dicarboxylate N-succinyltransferase